MAAYSRPAARINPDCRRPKAALKCVAEEKFDLLISDIGLPDGSGLEVMEQAKRRYNLKGIALSGFGMDESPLPIE